MEFKTMVKESYEIKGMNLFNSNSHGKFIQEFLDKLPKCKVLDLNIKYDLKNNTMEFTAEIEVLTIQD